MISPRERARGVQAGLTLDAVQRSRRAYSRSFEVRWKLSIRRIVPDFERITTEWVVAPPPKAEEEPKPADNKLVWGKYDAPKWKKAGLAASAALTVVSLGVAIGTYMAIRPGGKLKKDLIQAAKDSETDKSGTNDISPYTDQDLCAQARTPVSGGVKNGEMTKICNKADGLATAATAGFIATGIFAASTVVFTTLLFVHKNKPGVAKLQKHGLTLGAMPLRSGGAIVGGVVRF